MKQQKATEGKYLHKDGMIAIEVNLPDDAALWEEITEEQKIEIENAQKEDLEQDHPISEDLEENI